MTGASRRQRIQALLFAAIMVVSMVAAGVGGLAGSAVAQDGSADFVVDDDFSEPDNSTNFSSIQPAIDMAESGDTINVYPGTYEEIAKDRNAYGSTGEPHSFGLYVGTDNLTIRGVTAEGEPITETENVQAEIVSLTSVSFGTNGPFIAADDTTIQGLELTPNPDASPNKNLEVTGNNLSLKSNVINGDIGSVYFATSEVQSLSVVGNHISAGLSFNNGVGNETEAENRIVEDNEIGLISFAGAQPEVDWRNYAVGPVTIEDNTIRGHSFVLEYEDEEGNTQTYVYEGVFSRVGSVTEATEFPELFDDNTVLRGSYIENDTEPTGVENLGTETSPDYEVAYSPQESINATMSGDTVILTNGTYEENITLNTPNVTLRGAGSSVVDGRIDIPVDGVAVRNLTVRNGAPSSFNEPEGIFVGNSSGFSNLEEEIEIRDVTVEDVHAHGTDTTVKGIHVKYYESGDPISGINIENVTVQNVTQTAAGASGVKLQAEVSDVSVTNSTFEDIEGSWAYGVVATPSNLETGVPDNVLVTQTTISNISAVDYDGVGVGIDGSEENGFANASEVDVTRTSFYNNGIDILNKEPDGNSMSALLNYFDEGPSITGDVAYDPVLTTPAENVESKSVAEINEYGSVLELNNGGGERTLAVGFSAPPDANASEIFDDAGIEGNAYTYGDNGYNQIAGSFTPETGEVIVFTTTEAIDRGIVVPIDTSVEGAAASPEPVDVENGWNLVATGAAAGIDDIPAALNGGTIQDSTQLQAQPRQPGLAGEPEGVGAFDATWIFVNGEGEIDTGYSENQDPNRYSDEILYPDGQSPEAADIPDQTDASDGQDDS